MPKMVTMCREFYQTLTCESVIPSLLFELRVQHLNLYLIVLIFLQILITYSYNIIWGLGLFMRLKLWRNKNIYELV